MGFPTLCRPGMAGEAVLLSPGDPCAGHVGADRMSSLRRPGTGWLRRLRADIKLPPLRAWSSRPQSFGDACSEWGELGGATQSNVSAVQFASGTVAHSGVPNPRRRAALRQGRRGRPVRWRPQLAPPTLHAPRKASQTLCHHCRWIQLAGLLTGGGEQNAPASAPMANITGDRVGAVL